MATSDEVRNKIDAFLTEEDFVGVVREPEDSNIKRNAGVPLLFKNMADVEQRLKLKSRHCDENIEKSVRITLEKLQTLLHLKNQRSAYTFTGTFTHISTLIDGKGNVTCDYLFINKQPDIELMQTKKNPCDFKVTSDNDEIQPLHINDAFRSSLDDIFQEDISLPENLQYAGFAGPEYSGVRRNGSATSVLLSWSNGQLIILNLTLVLPVPPEAEAEFLEEVLKKTSPIREENEETAFDLVQCIHLVPKPPPHDKVWTLSTLLLEKKLLGQIHASAPVNKMMKYVDAFLDHFENKAHRAVKYTEPEECIKDMAVELEILLDFYISNRPPDMRGDIIKVMRYAHEFLTPEQLSKFKEIPKLATSINSYGFKNLILQKAAEIPGCFTPTAGTQVADMLLVAVMEEIAQPQEVPQFVQHYFFNYSIPLWSVSTVGAGYKSTYVDIARRQCQKMAKRIQQKSEFKERTPFVQRYDIIEPAARPRTLTLRPYQDEIVRKVQTTRNCIVFMPRNTGKGHVAVKLAEEAISKHQKVVHLNTTHSGLWDRWTMYKRYLPDCRSIMVHSERNRCTDHVSFETIVEEHDVILTSPVFLLEQLINGLLTLEMLHCVFVENCDRYNQIGRLFKYYLEQKLKCQAGNLPKIIGFTAHLGTGQSKSVGKSTKLIMKTCAFMDANDIIQVEDLNNKHQMAESSHETNQEKIELPSWSTQSEFENRIKLLEVQMLEDLLKDKLSLPEKIKSLLKSAIDGTFKAKRHNWVNDCRNIADKHFFSSDLRLKLEMILIRHKMNTLALHLNNAIGGQYAQDFLRDELGKKTKPEKNIYEIQLDKLYAQGVLEPGRWCAYTSPRLDRLRQVLTDWRHTRRHMRTIVCCSSLSMTQFLFKWMKSEFVGIRIDIFQGIKQESADHTSNKLFEQFKNGNIHVLFMSSTASWTHDLKPDLEVLYNDPDDIMTLSKVVAPGEVVPVTRREQLRDDALLEIRGMSPADYKSQLLEEQHKLLRP